MRTGSPFALASLDGEALGNTRKFLVEFFALNETEWEFNFRRPSEYREATGVTPHIHDDGEVHKHMDVRGQYVVNGADFQSAGLWELNSLWHLPMGHSFLWVGLAFNVLSTSAAPGIGEAVPATRNATVHDVDNIEEIDTRVPPDEMHELSVADAP